MWKHAQYIAPIRYNILPPITIWTDCLELRPCTSCDCSHAKIFSLPEHDVCALPPCSLGAQITCRDCAKKRPPTAVFSFTNGQKLRSRWTAILGPQISLWRGNLARLSRTTIFSWPKTSLGAICVHMYTGGLQPLLPWWKVILKNQKIQPSFINACSLCNLRSCAYRLWTDDRGGGTSQWSRIVERITHGIVHAQIYSNSQNIHTRILIDLVVRYCMNSGSSESSDSDF